jgi:hypothetical protein
MADAVKTFDLRDRVSRRAGRFGPVVGSALGVLWESAGLVWNVAGLGIALVSDTRQAAPKKPAPKRLPAPGASNVVPFPATQGTKPAATNRSRS